MTLVKEKQLQLHLKLSLGNLLPWLARLPAKEVQMWFQTSRGAWQSTKIGASAPNRSLARRPAEGQQPWQKYMQNSKM